MQTNNIPQEDQALNVLSLRDLTEVLIKHYGLHEGRYDLAISFQVGFGAVGPNPETQCPGAVIGVSQIGLAKATIDGPNTVDAAIINPLTVKKKLRPKQQ